jgi:uncharacterized protein
MSVQIVQGFLFAAAFTFMMAGLIGLIVPVFPGLTVIWLAALVYAIFTGLNAWGWVVLVLITLLMIAGSLIDNVLMGRGALKTGATGWTLAMGWIGGLAGSILLPPLGGIPGAILAVFLYDFLKNNDWRRSLQMTKSVALGWGWAFVIRLAMGIVMIGLWLIWSLSSLPPAA